MSTATTTATPSIGSACLSNDGTLTLRLRAEGIGIVGDGELVYAPTHPDYASVRAHVEAGRALSVGEVRAVRPWG